MVQSSGTKKITLPIARRRKSFKKSHITNTEWALIIGALEFIDLIELILGFFVIGEFVNTFIDWIVGPSLAFYLFMRGEDLSSSKRVISLIGSFFLELIPIINNLPLWTLDGLYLMSLSRVQNREAEREEKKEGEYNKTQLAAQNLAILEQKQRLEVLKAKRLKQEEENLAA